MNQKAPLQLLIPMMKGGRRVLGRTKASINDYSELIHPLTDFIHFCVCSPLDSCVGLVESEEIFFCSKDRKTVGAEGRVAHKTVSACVYGSIIAA